MELDSHLAQQALREALDTKEVQEARERLNHISERSRVSTRMQGSDIIHEVFTLNQWNDYSRSDPVQRFLNPSTLFSETGCAVEGRALDYGLSAVRSVQAVGGSGASQPGDGRRAANASRW